MKHPFIPSNATVAELERKASECEERATQEQASLANELREQAKTSREWAARLRSGRWTS